VAFDVQRQVRFASLIHPQHRPPAKVSPGSKKRFSGDRQLGHRCFPSQEGLEMTGKRTAASILMMAAAGLAACDGINDPSEAGNLVPKPVDEDPTIPSP